LVREKRLEGARQHIGGHAGAGVADRDHDIGPRPYLGIRRLMVRVELDIAVSDVAARPPAWRRGVHRRIDDGVLELTWSTVAGHRSPAAQQPDLDVLAEAVPHQPSMLSSNSFTSVDLRR